MIQKIWQALTQIDLGYAHLINDAMNRFSQEIMDFDNFTINDSQSTSSYDETIKILSNTLDETQYKMYENTALEFCITNDYAIDGKRWNCIEHLIEHHDLLFSRNGIKYLEALNNSYTSIYEVQLLEDGAAVKLSSMLKKSDIAIISEKKQVSDLKGYKLVAARVLQIETKHKVVHKISDTLLPITQKIANESIHIINFIQNEMNLSSNKKCLSSLPQNQILLQKKMMVKEILEQWYLHAQNNL